MYNVDPNGPGIKSNGIFGLPFTEDDSEIVIIPVEWDVTTSFRDGTSKTPETLRELSPQIELFHPKRGHFWKKGIAYSDLKNDYKKITETLRIDAKSIIEQLEENLELTPILKKFQSDINKESEKLNNTIYEHTLDLLKKNKKTILLGGDHSCSFGHIKALSDSIKNVSILQIDAHMDLREKYEGFSHSHASIIRNIKELTSVKKITQVGIRDFCEEEKIYAAENNITVFYDSDLKENAYIGKNWHSQCEDIINTLTDNVYITLDIDGLTPANCPNTGTPVPGGLEYSETIYLLEMLKQSKKTIVGADLVEVSPHGEVDTIIGMQLLYQLCSLV